jgi:hypothetical protein
MDRNTYMDRDTDADSHTDRYSHTDMDMDMDPTEIYADGSDIPRKFVHRGMIPG